MKQKDYLKIVSIVFLIVAAIHLLRIISGWELVIDGNMIPMWASWIGVVFAGWLSYKAHKLK